MERTFCLFAAAAFFVCVAGQDHATIVKRYLSSGKIREFIDYFGQNKLDPFSLKDSERRNVLHWIASIPPAFRDRQNDIWRQLLSPLSPSASIVSAADKDGNTPLHAAVAGLNSRYAGWLMLNYDVRLDVKNKNGSTPLHLAVESGSRGMVLGLLKDEKVSSKLLYAHDANGRTALHIAVDKDLFKIVEDLCQVQEATQDSYVHYRPFGNPSAYQLAISLKRLKILEYFIVQTKKIIDLQNRNLEGSTALQASLQFPSPRITRLLLRRFGNDVNQLYYEDLFGHNILHYAAKFGNIEVFDEVVQRTPKSDVVQYITAKSSAQSWTPLHFAAANGQAAIVTSILAQTMSGIDSLDKNGLTPLMVAAGLCFKFPDGNYPILELLVNNGASRTFRNPHDKNAMTFCSEQEVPQCKCDILSPSVVLKPVSKNNCSAAIQKLFGDDGTMPPVTQAALFNTPFTIPLSNDPLFDPNLTPRYQHRCGRIINGQPCFHVDIYSGNNFFGSGAIIDEDFVSTSASIFPNLNRLAPDASKITVHLTTKSKKVFQVSQLFRHVNYKGGFDSDTVLLYLAQNIDFQLEQACPICLPFESFDKTCFSEMACYMVGSKQGNLNEAANSPWLLFEAGPTSNKTKCQGIWNDFKELPDSTHCVENKDDWCMGASSNLICVHKGVARLLGHQSAPRDPGQIKLCSTFNAQTVVSLISSEATRTFYRTTLQIKQRLPAENIIKTAQDIPGICDKHVDTFLEINITSCPVTPGGSGGVDKHTVVNEKPGQRVQLSQAVDRSCIGTNGKLVEGAIVSYKCSRTYYKLEGDDVVSCGPKGWNGALPRCKLICGKVFGTVFNGVRAREKEMPWAVALLNVKSQPSQAGSLPRISCGGSLISTNWVLTAAHCLQESVSRPTLYHPDDIKVFIGLKNNYEASEAFSAPAKDVSKIIAHENFEAWQLQNDVALLQLSSHVILNDKVQVICLPPPDFPVEDYELVKVAAWGSKGVDEAGHQDLMIGSINLEACAGGQLLCSGHYSDFGSNISLASLCRGDSGSPVMVEIKEDTGKIYYQVGIVSGKASRVSCEDLAAGLAGDVERPVRIMRVQNYIDWINGKIGKE